TSAEKCANCVPCIRLPMLALHGAVARAATACRAAGGVHDARSAVLHRGALEHSTGHACPASHAPRTSRPSMSVAGIAGNPGFFVPPGALLELCRSRGALSPNR